MQEDPQRTLTVGNETAVTESGRVGLGVLRKRVYLFLICKAFKLPRHLSESRIRREMGLRNKVGLLQLLQRKGRRGWWRT